MSHEQAPGNRGLRPRSLPLSLLLIVGTVTAGLLVRFAPLGLPTLVQKYGGSCLWALMVYWLVSTVRPALRVLPAVGLSSTIATAIEFFKLYRSPSVDAFRLTLPGILLLGKYFSVWDIVAYWLAIIAGGSLDRLLRTSRLGSSRVE